MPIIKIIARIVKKRSKELLFLKSLKGWIIEYFNS